MKKKETILIALSVMVCAILLAVINPTWQDPVKIKNHAPEVIAKDSLWQTYCKNGDTASAKTNINKWVIIGNSKDMLNPFMDTVFATYWQRITQNEYTVTCDKYISITVEFCRLLPDSVKK